MKNPKRFIEEVRGLCCSLGIHVGYLISVIILLLFGSVNVGAQITIGSTLKPNDGTLLDLKEYDPASNNSTSTRGLVLPRIILTDLYNLYPMFEDSPGSGIPNADYAGALKATRDKEHVGLLVYNLDDCKGIADGLYTWTGSNWQQMRPKDAKGALTDILVNGQSNKTTDTMTFYIASGADLRNFDPQQSFSIGWKREDLTASIASITNTVGGGISFASNDPSTWTVSANPTTFPYQVNNMHNLPGIWYENPWQSRETQVKFATSVDECGKIAEKIIVLNQTNFAMQFFNSDEYHAWKIGDFNLLLRDVYNGWDSFNLNVKSNAAWVARYTEVTPGIVGNYTNPPKGGKDVLTGSFYDNSNQYQDPGFNFYPSRTGGISASDNNKYKIAGYITFSDSIAAPNNRFEPIQVNIVKCQGIPDMSSPSIIDGNTIPESSWGESVVKHEDQQGNIFYSAYFGNAGRWMITNLAATAYDSGEGGGTVNPYDDDETAAKRKYTYPGPGPNIYVGWDEPQDWAKPSEWHLEQGLLYNWFAAANIVDTAALKVVGTQDQYAVGVDNIPGPNEVEQRTESWYKGTAPNAYLQGICPDGWHLPSDREWNRLEKEIYNNVSKYSIYTSKQISKFAPANWQESFELSKHGDGSPERGSKTGGDAFGHGAAMNEMCTVNDLYMNWLSTSKGFSKPPWDGGFNLMHVGIVEPGLNINTDEEEWIKQHYGYTTILWSSSTDYAGTALIRHSNLSESTIKRYNNKLDRYYSVRCVRNEIRY